MGPLKVTHYHTYVGTETYAEGLPILRDRVQPSLTKLKVVAGPDDYGRPCLTIILPDED